MTATAPEAEELRILDAGTRQAWKTYSDRVRDLRGDEYERVEQEAWVELQSELRRLERRRQALTCVTS